MREPDRIAATVWLKGRPDQPTILLQCFNIAEQGLVGMTDYTHASVRVSIRDEQLQQLLKDTDLQKLPVALDGERTGV